MRRAVSAATGLAQIAWTVRVATAGPSTADRFVWPAILLGYAVSYFVIRRERKRRPHAKPTEEARRRAETSALSSALAGCVGKDVAAEARGAHERLVAAQREEILTAFRAKFRAEPEEIVQEIESRPGLTVWRARVRTEEERRAR